MNTVDYKAASHLARDLNLLLHYGCNVAICLPSQELGKCPETDCVLVDRLRAVGWRCAVVDVGLDDVSPPLAVVQGLEALVDLAGVDLQPEVGGPSFDLLDRFAHSLQALDSLGYAQVIVLAGFDGMSVERDGHFLAAFKALLQRTSKLRMIYIGSDRSRLGRIFNGTSSPLCSLAMWL